MRSAESNLFGDLKEYPRLARLIDITGARDRFVRVGEQELVRETFAVRPGSVCGCRLHRKRRVVRLLGHGQRRFQKLRVRNLATMLGRCARDRRQLWT